MPPDQQVPWEYVRRIVASDRLTGNVVHDVDLAQCELSRSQVSGLIHRPGDFVFTVYANSDCNRLHIQDHVYTLLLYAGGFIYWCMYLFACLLVYMVVVCATPRELRYENTCRGYERDPDKMVQSVTSYILNLWGAQVDARWFDYWGSEALLSSTLEVRPYVVDQRSP